MPFLFNIEIICCLVHCLNIKKLTTARSVGNNWINFLLLILIARIHDLEWGNDLFLQEY